MVRKITLGIAKGTVRASEVMAIVLGGVFLLSVIVGWSPATVWFRIYMSFAAAVFIALSVYAEVTKEAKNHGNEIDN